MSFLKTLGTLSAGPLGWTDADLVRVATASILSKPTLSETLTTSDSTLLINAGFTTVAKTIVFTAPVAMTIRNMVFYPTRYDEVDKQWQDTSAFISLGQITIAGTGPDVGTHVEGIGVPGALFNLPNLLTAPRLNYRLDAGDTISCTTYNTTNDTLSYQVALTYDEGLDTSVKPTKFLGGPTAPLAFTSVPAAAAASGIITVTGATSPGDDIRIIGQWAENVSNGVGAGGELNGSSGGGGAGLNTWDTDVVGVTAIRDEILAQLLDSTNQWEATYEFTDNGGSSDEILVTRREPGPHGNTDQLVVTSAGLSVSGATLTGGLAATAAIAMGVPAISLDIDRVFFGNANSGEWPTPFYRLQPLQITALKVGGVVQTSFAPTFASPDLITWKGIQGASTIPASAVVTIEVQQQMGQVALLFCLAGTAT